MKRNLKSKRKYPNTIDETGNKYGKLTVIKQVENKNPGAYWLCKCSCGKEVIRWGTYLRGCRKTSCGCEHREQTRALGKSRKKHGLSYEKIYEVWRNMMARCYIPSSREYCRYGKIGREVCKRWHKLENFIKDMGKTYNLHVKEYGSRETTIERINNNLGYSPKNCRWATRKEQSRNTSTTHYVNICGEVKSLAEWSEIYGINKGTISARISSGWDEISAVVKPIQIKYRNKTI